MKRKFTQKYNPQYFLASLGNGGLAVSFFMYLMFLLKHPETPIPTFDHLKEVFTGGSSLSAVLVSFVLAGILYFSYRHFSLLIWNIRLFLEYKRTEDYIKLKNSNAEVTLMALPLTYGMSVNVVFVLGALFIPGLWKNVEMLFPVSLLALGAIGVYALKLFSEYFSRLIVNGDFDFINNNNLGQLLSSFAFAMVSVGLAAPGAMSENIIVSAVGILGSIFFATISILLLVIKLVLGFKSIFKQGISKENAPSLLIVIPVMTLLGIAFVRIASGIYHNLMETQTPPTLMFVILAFLVSVQIIIGLIGYVVMDKTQYFKDYINGSKNSVGSYTLICPGVATFVLGMFFVHWGLVKTNIIASFTLGHFTVLLPLAAIQALTVITLFKIDKKMLCGRKCA